MALRLRRGTDAQRQLVTPLDGELVYTTDTKKLYVGDGTTAGGNAVDTAGTNLGSNLDLSGFNITGTGNVQVDGNITATGNLTVDGNFTLGGNITVGDASTDTINFAAKIESSLIPDVSGARNVGSPSNKFGTVYADFLSVTDSIEATSLNANIIGNDSTVLLNVATGEVNVSGTLKGNVTASDNTSFFNATSKAVNAGAATFTGAVSAASITSTFTGDLKGSLVADDSTVIVDGVAGTVRLRNGEIDVVGNTIYRTGNDAFINFGDDSSAIINLVMHNSDSSDMLQLKTLTGNSIQTASKISIKSRSGSFASPVSPSGGDIQGIINAQSYDAGSANYTANSSINFEIDNRAGSVGAGFAYGKLSFNANAGTSGTPDFKTFTWDSQARMAINKTDADANLDVNGDVKLSGASASLLLGNLTTVQRDALTPANGMIIYNTTDNKFQGYENGAWANLI